MVNLNNLFSAKGQFISATFKSEKKPSASFKGVRLEKLIEGTFRAGINFANLGSIKEGIESGERGEVQSLPWGAWLQFPYTISHKEEIYVRLYPTENCKLKATYLVDGVEVTRDKFLSYLTPSEQARANEGERPECITIKKSNLLKLG
jgi:hypothetical protein